MTYLCSTVVNYRSDTEAEAKALIEENKASNYGEVTKYSCVHKEVKATKTHDADDFYLVAITRFINDPKEPYTSIKINYGVDDNG